MATHLINSIRFVLIRFSGCLFTCHCLPVSLLACSFIHYFPTFQWRTYVFYLPATRIITSQFMNIIPFVYSFDESPSLWRFFSLFLSNFCFSCTTDEELWEIYFYEGNQDLKKLFFSALSRAANIPQNQVSFSKMSATNFLLIF